jgi:hypothetical protein
VNPASGVGEGGGTCRLFKLSSGGKKRLSFSLHSRPHPASLAAEVEKRKSCVRKCRRRNNFCWMRLMCSNSSRHNRSRWKRRMIYVHTEEQLLLDEITAQQQQLIQEVTAEEDESIQEISGQETLNPKTLNPKP